MRIHLQDGKYPECGARTDGLGCVHTAATRQMASPMPSVPQNNVNEHYFVYLERNFLVKGNISILTWREQKMQRR